MKCKLQPDWIKEDPYNEVNCIERHMIQESLEKCGCIPWYMKHLDLINKNSTLCMAESFKCFEANIKNYKSPQDN